MRKLAVIFGAAFAVTLALGLIGHAMRQKPIMPYDPAATAEHEASGERPGEASLIPGGASSASAATSPLKSSPLKTEDKTKTPEPPLVPTPPLANSPNKSKPSDKSKSPDAWKPAWPGDKSAKKIPK